jgi:uncharacterized membrane protein required for colicin V production
MLLNLDQILAVVTGIVVLWLIVITVLFYSVHSSLKKLTKGVSKKDLKTLLEKLLKDFNQQEKEIKGLLKTAEEFRKDNLYNIQKIGLVRYNPFAETGGDQSFCLSLLDGNDSAIERAKKVR